MPKILKIGLSSSNICRKYCRLFFFSRHGVEYILLHSSYTTIITEMFNCIFVSIASVHGLRLCILSLLLLCIYWHCQYIHNSSFRLVFVFKWSVLLLLWLMFYTERSWWACRGRETQHAENVHWETEYVYQRCSFKNALFLVCNFVPEYRVFFFVRNLEKFFLE